MESKFEFIRVLQPTSLYSCRKKKNSSAILQFPSLTPPVSILYTFQKRFFIFFSRCLILNSRMRYTGRSFFFCLGASFRLGMGRHPPQHFYVQSIRSLFHLSTLASVLSPTYRMLFFTEHSSFFFILFQLKGRKRNKKIKSFKIASGDKILSNYFTTVKKLFQIHHSCFITPESVLFCSYFQRRSLVTLTEPRLTVY
jgi:hypothetical protein